MSKPITSMFIPTNGITLHARVAGSGPLLLLVHGWPELSYSWRHQIKPLADAGYRVCAIDVRRKFRFGVSTRTRVRGVDIAP